MLHALNPEKFKDLIITAVRRDKGEFTTFDHINSPDVEIALSVRASCSIPLFFKPVVIDGIEYVDGGYMDNIPLDAFANRKDKENIEVEDLTDSPEKVHKARKQGRTLALAFGGDVNDPTHVSIYSAKSKIVEYGAVVSFIMDVVFKTIARVGGKFKYTEQEEKTHQKLRDNALNTILLDTKDIGTLSFEDAQKEAEYLRIKGEIQTARYFDLHGIAPITDPNFEQKDFVLKVYEESKDKGMVQEWKNKIIGGKQEKSAELLKFADSKWSDNASSQETLKDFVLLAATSRSDSSLSNNTNTMQAIVKSLNDAFTPNVVKEDFIKLLEIDTKNDKRFDQNKSLEENLTKFKFDTKDFDKLIAKSKTTSTIDKKLEDKGVKFQDKVVKSKEKENLLTKEKPKTMSDKVKKDRESVTLTQKNR